MTKFAGASSLASLAPRIAKAGTIPAACVRIVDELARTMKWRCAVLENREHSWEVVSRCPRELEVPEDRKSAIEIALGRAGGVERSLLIVGQDGKPAPDAAAIDLLQNTLTHALEIVAMRAEI